MLCGGRANTSHLACYTAVQYVVLTLTRVLHPGYPYHAPPADSFDFCRDFRIYDWAAVFRVETHEEARRRIDRLVLRVHVVCDPFRSRNYQFVILHRVFCIMHHNYNLRVKYVFNPLFDSS